LRVEVIAYTDRFSARPGERIDFLVSTERPSYEVAIVRHDRFFDVPDPARDTVIASPVDGTHPGRFQAIPIGSYTRVEDAPALRFTAGFTLQTWIYPTLPARGREQGIVAKWDGAGSRGFGIGLDADGTLIGWVGNGAPRSVVVLAAPLIPSRWYAVALRFDTERGELRLDRTMLRRSWLPEEHEFATVAVDPGALSTADDPLLIGASELAPMRDGKPGPVDLYNGKVDRVRLWDRALTDAELAAIEAWGDPASIPGSVAAWDPSLEIAGTAVRDTGPHGLHGVIVNQPGRGVCGANWDGSEVVFRLKPEHYGAIAYHEDDLADCRWEVDFGYEIPAGLPGGLYAARMSAGESIEYVPFYVRPPLAGPAAPVLYLAPTNTYLAYGNERLFKASTLDPDFVEKTTPHQFEWTEREQWHDQHPELGSSVYDLHPDGTGISYSTRLRPVVTMRPQFKLWINGFSRHYASDLFLIEWLERKGFAYDVATDEDLHVDGLAALSRHKVVVTGSHPEYWTTPMLAALRDYLAGGGKLMYLGGNGFYWVTAIAPDRPHLIEVRRGINGTRAWTSHPGEVYLSLTGEQGGLWRYRGQDPNRLVGVGFASEGWGGAEGYDQLPDSRDPRVDFIFEDIDPNEVIGAFGEIMGGASGDEIDRYDLEHGTPPETLRLATSEGRHSNYYQLVVEDTTMVLPGRGGQEDPRVRSDITLLEGAHGGAVFAAGSINWNGSLLTNGTENNVSRITENVLRTFMGVGGWGLKT
jgi:N,N-dimethylformamidase